MIRNVIYFKIIKLHDGQDLIVLILDGCMCVFMYENVKWLQATFWVTISIIKISPKCYLHTIIYYTKIHLNFEILIPENRINVITN